MCGRVPSRSQPRPRLRGGTPSPRSHRAQGTPVTWVTKVSNAVGYRTSNGRFPKRENRTLVVIPAEPLAGAHVPTSRYRFQRARAGGGWGWDLPELLCCFRSSSRLAVGCVFALVFLWRLRKKKQAKTSPVRRLSTLHERKRRVLEPQNLISSHGAERGDGVNFRGRRQQKVVFPPCQRSGSHC